MQPISKAIIIYQNWYQNHLHWIALRFSATHYFVATPTWVRPMSKFYIYCSGGKRITHSRVNYYHDHHNHWAVAPENYSELTAVGAVNHHDDYVDTLPPTGLNHRNHLMSNWSLVRGPPHSVSGYSVFQFGRRPHLHHCHRQTTKPLGRHRHAELHHHHHPSHSRSEDYAYSPIWCWPSDKSHGWNLCTLNPHRLNKLSGKIIKKSVKIDSSHNRKG